MLLLGLQGSPRKKGNTAYLLSSFINETEKVGVRTHVLEVSRMNIQPCKGCGFCETNGYCVIKDDEMYKTVYPLLREAEAVVIATPVFFYSVPSPLKALIDRSQALWSRKYKLNLSDPAGSYRRGFLLAQGATKGKNLFEGLSLTAKYFFDAIGAAYIGRLTYRQIENRGDMAKHPTVLEDVKKAAGDFVSPLIDRKTILFVCRENACRSQMAAAFARHLAGERFDVLSAGSEPAAQINPIAAKVMEEKGIDMAFRQTRALDEAISTCQPQIIVTMGCGEACPFIPGAERRDWDLPDPAGRSVEFMRTVRDEIARKVRDLIGEQG